MAVMRFTEEAVRKLKPPAKPARDLYFDAHPMVAGLSMLVSYTGRKAFRVIYYVNQKPLSLTFGRFDPDGIDGSAGKPVPESPVVDRRTPYTVAGARRFVERFNVNPAKYLDQNYPKQKQLGDGDTCLEVISRYLDVVAVKFRTFAEIKRCQTKYVLPTWGALPFTAMKRSHVSRLRDEIIAANGERMAAIVIAQLRAIMIWYEQYDDNYNCPIKNRDAKATGSKKKSRERSLTDHEIRELWRATDSGLGEPRDTYSAFVRLLLLTAARREKVLTMEYTDIDDLGVWHIKSEDDREKNHAGTLKLSPLALATIAWLPRRGTNPHLFPGIKTGPMNGLSKNKARLNSRLEIAPWVLHDLRRTASGLMNRTTRPDIVERVLGHAIPGVSGTYNQYDYFDEKAEALRLLSATVQEILTSGAVVPFKSKAKK